MAMRWKNESFFCTLYVCWRKPADAHVEWIIASYQHLKSIKKTSTRQVSISKNIGGARAHVASIATPGHRGYASKMPCEMFSDRNDTLRDDGRSAPNRQRKHSPQVRGR